MDKWLKKRAALYMLIKLVDENNGCIDINNDKVKRVFNDADEIVRVEYATGEVALLSDADYDTMNDAVLKWQTDNLKL